MNFMRNTVHKPFEDAMRFDNLTTVILKTPESDINMQLQIMLVQPIC